ncbi:MAG: phage baseplate protein [Parabacteroides sp.]
MNLANVWTLANAITSATSATTLVAGATGPWTPPQWSGLTTDTKQLIYVKSNIGGLFFDAIFHEETTSSIKITDHPVQNGSNIVDHSYVQPTVLTMDIGVSDSMGSIVTGQFTGSYTKSVSAYTLLLALQTSRIPLEVHTRLNHYTNMLIEQITAPDDYKTLHGLKCSVQMKEIFIVEVGTTTVSARSQTTATTSGGTAQPTVDNGSVLAQAATAITG